MRPSLPTPNGEIPLDEARLFVEGREWSVLHTGAVITEDDERRFLAADVDRLPYGCMLWPSSVALAHDVAGRDLAGARVLELGAGTGLPGLVAASRGAHVVQTDNDDLALHVAGLNAERNGVLVERRRADWATFEPDDGFDLVLGADVLYATSMHRRLRAIFDACGAPVLIADPFRPGGQRGLDRLRRDGWRVESAKRTVDVDGKTRAIGVYELRR